MFSVRSPSNRNIENDGVVFRKPSSAQRVRKPLADRPSTANGAKFNGTQLDKTLSATKHAKLNLVKSPNMSEFKYLDNYEYTHKHIDEDIYVYNSLNIPKLSNWQILEHFHKINENGPKSPIVKLELQKIPKQTPITNELKPIEVPEVPFPSFDLDISF